MKITPIPEDAKQKTMVLWQNKQIAEMVFNNYCEGLISGLGLKGSQFVNMETLVIEDRNEEGSEKLKNVFPMGMDMKDA